MSTIRVASENCCARPSGVIVARGLGRGVLGRANGEGIAVARGSLAVGRHELEGLDRLRHTVFFDGEIVRRERADRLAPAIDDGHVDAHEVRLGAERGRLRGLWLLRRLQRKSGYRCDTCESAQTHFTMILRAACPECC